VDGRSSRLYSSKVLFRSHHPETLDHVRRACRRPLDLKHEHCFGRQQETLPELRPNLNSDSIYDDDVLGGRSLSRLSSHGFTMRYGLHVACSFRSEAPLFPMEPKDPNKNKREQKDNEPSIRFNVSSNLPSGRLRAEKLQIGDPFNRPKLGSKFVQKHRLLLLLLSRY
jgi:hypothetical protein